MFTSYYIDDNDDDDDDDADADDGDDEQASQQLRYITSTLISEYLCYFILNRLNNIVISVSLLNLGRIVLILFYFVCACLCVSS